MILYSQFWNFMSFLHTESCTWYHRGGHQRDFRRIRWPFNINCTIAKSFKWFNTTATSIRRATAHINWLRKSVSAASHESVNLEKFLMDVAKCGCYGIHYWSTMFTNYLILYGNRSWSKTFKIGYFGPWTLAI